MRGTPKNQTVLCIDCLELGIKTTVTLSERKVYFHRCTTHGKQHRYETDVANRQRREERAKPVKAHNLNMITRPAGLTWYGVKI